MPGSPMVEKAVAAQVENTGLNISEVEVEAAAAADAEEERPVPAGEREGRRNRKRLGRRTAAAEEGGEANK